MKFSQQFEASQFEEWKKKYLRYVSIKQHIIELFPETRSSKDKAAVGKPVEEYGTLKSSARQYGSTIQHLEDEEKQLAGRPTSSLLSVEDRGDQILTKLLTDLHKIDDFYRAVEGELLVGFQSLQAQVSSIVFERKRKKHGNNYEATTNASHYQSTPLGTSTNGGMWAQTGTRVRSVNTIINTPQHFNSKTQKESKESSPSPSSSPNDKEMSIILPSALHHSFSTGSVPSYHQHPTITLQSPPPSASTTNSNQQIQSSVQINGTGIHNLIPNPSSLSHSSSSLPSTHSSHDYHHHQSYFHAFMRHNNPNTQMINEQREKEEDIHDLNAALEPLKSSFIHLLKRMTMLIHFVDINVYAFHKLLKFFEKRSGLIGIEEKFTRILKSRYLSTSRVLEDELIPATNKLFADYYEGGDIEKARVFLLAKLSEAEYDRIDTFFLGMKIGVIMMLFIWNIMLLIRPIPGQSSLESLTLYAPIYRATGLLIFWLWLWGLCIYVWDANRIAYVFIFQLNPRQRLTHFVVFNEAATLTIVYLVNCLLLISHYEKVIDERVSSAVYPLALFLYCLLKLFLPSNFFSHWHTRETLLSSLGQILISPFGRVRFRETYIADVLTSMVKLLIDVEYSFIYLFVAISPALSTSLNLYGSTAVPIIICAPLWLRFMQCLRRYHDTRQRFPHLANSLKYAVSHSVVIISTFHPYLSDKNVKEWDLYRSLWACSFIASSLYTFIWDVTLDWGLFQWKGHATHWLLREHLLYSSSIFYYWAVFSNFFLRFVWVITLIPFTFDFPFTLKNLPTTYLSTFFSSSSLLLPSLIALELFRRMQWSLLRVEWEQIIAGSGFRLSYYAPMLFSESGVGSANNKSVSDLAVQSSLGIILEVTVMVVIVLVVAVLGAVY